MNVARGSSNSLLDLIAILGSVVGHTVDCDFQPERLGDVRDSYADVTLARELLGYELSVSLEEGIKSMVDGLAKGSDR